MAAVGVTGAAGGAAAAVVASSVELPFFLQASSAPTTNTAHNITDERDPITTSAIQPGVVPRQSRGILPERHGALQPLPSFQRDEMRDVNEIEQTPSLRN